MITSDITSTTIMNIITADVALTGEDPLLVPVVGGIQFTPAALALG